MLILLNSNYSNCTNRSKGDQRIEHYEQIKLL